MKLKQLCLCLAVALLWSPSFGIVGDFSLDVESQELSDYQKFGFQEGGTIQKEIELDATQMHHSMVYYFICQKDAQNLVEEAEKDNTICLANVLQEIVEACAFNYIVFGDAESNTKVLPFKTADFAKELHQQTEYLKHNIFGKALGNKASKGDFEDEGKDRRILTQKLKVYEIVATTWLKYEEPLDFQESAILSNESLNSTVLLNAFQNDILQIVEEKGTYHFNVINCIFNVEMKIDYVLLNPNGEHLSLGELENKAVFHFMIISWAILFGFWILTWINNVARKRKTYPLHYFFVAFGSLWFAYSILEERYWNYFSLNGYPPMDLRVVSTIIRSIAFSLNLALFFLIGKGYTYINLTLKKKDKREIGIMFLLRVILTWLREFFGNNALTIGSIVLLYAVSMFMIYQDFKKNLAKIHKLKSRILENVPVDVAHESTNQQQEQQRREQNLEEQNIDQIMMNINNLQRAHDSSKQNNMVEDQLDEGAKKEIKALNNKKSIVKMVRFFILSHVGFLIVAFIVGSAAFAEKAYVVNIWNQILLALTYLQFTWFFNYRYTRAFQYTMKLNQNDDQSLYEADKQNRDKSALDPEDLHQIVDEICFVENQAQRDEIMVACKVQQKKQLKKKSAISLEKESDGISFKVRRHKESAKKPLKNYTISSKSNSRESFSKNNNDNKQDSLEPVESDKIKIDIEEPPQVEESKIIDPNNLSMIMRESSSFEKIDVEHHSKSLDCSTLKSKKRIDKLQKQQSSSPKISAQTSFRRSQEGKNDLPQNASKLEPEEKST